MKAKLLIGLAGALALAACGQDAEEGADEAATPDLAAPAEDPAPPPNTPQSFVDTVAASDMYEVEAARLAQEMGTSEEVKAFAAMMIEDHTASSDKLREAASEAAGGLTVAPAMTPKQQQDLDALRNAGDNFDQVYAQQQVAAHEEALRLLEGYAGSGTEDSLKAFAAETATVVEGHLAEARELP